MRAQTWSAVQACSGSHTSTTRLPLLARSSRAKGLRFARAGLSWARSPRQLSRRIGAEWPAGSDRRAFVIRRAEPRPGRGEHAPLGDVVEQVALAPPHGDEGQAVVAGLLLGEFARAGPLDPAQVGVHHHQAVARHAGPVALLDDV